MRDKLLRAAQILMGSGCIVMLTGMTTSMIAWMIPTEKKEEEI